MRIASLRCITWLAIFLFLGAWANGLNTEFEGLYRVEDTTCSVKPIKMAFEVHWAEAKESVIFFYEWNSPFGDYTYVSEEKPGGVDRFVFSDKRLVSGVFIRSDGMRYPVNKIDSSR